MKGQAVYYTGFFLTGASFLVTALGLGLAAFVPGIDRWSKRFFRALFGVLFLTVCVYLADVVCYLGPGGVMAVILADFFLTLLSSATLPLLTVFLLHCSGEDWRGSPLFRAVISLWVLFFLLIVISEFNPVFYYVATDKEAHTGPLYPLLLIPPVGIELLNLTGLLRRRGRLSPRQSLCILLSLLPMTIALIVHMFVPVFPVLQICIALSAFTMFCFILAEQFGQYLRQQRENARQSASIMVLQMRPHFIHNTMMSIYYLCEQDPREAQRVTLNFNTYLEKNLSAIVSDETIPFSEELEHTRAYLDVEQALYDENLSVEYDTPHTCFRIPPLTLQPIVENAVKHALDPESEPIRITIRTRKTDAGSEIIVSDNGPGFEPAGENSPHITLGNIRQRLELTCGGKMTILPREGGGTVVRLTIP